MEIPRLLIVEDSAEVQLILSSTLQKKYDITAVTTGSAALAALKEKHYSLIILDIELPDEDGFKLCARMRLDESTKMTPIFFLSGRTQISDKVTAFRLGADDYMVKPFDPVELLARVEAKMAKVREQEDLNQNYTKGIFRVLPSLQKVQVLGDPQSHSGVAQDLSLTSIEFRLFTHFLRHEEHVLSREQILNFVWGQENHVTDRTVDTHVYTLRQKLGNLAKCIKSVPKTGYKFTQSEAHLLRKTS